MQFVARFVNVPVFQILKDNVEVANFMNKSLRDVYSLWRSQFHQLQSRLAHVWFSNASACVSVKTPVECTLASQSDANKQTHCGSV